MARSREANDPVVAISPRGIEEPRPCDPRESAADADSPDSGVRELRHGEGGSGEDVQGPGRDRRRDRPDIRQIPQPRSKQAIGASLGVGDKPANRLGQIRTPDNEPFRSASEDYTRAGVVDRRARRPDAIDGERELEQRIGRIPGRILDRQPGNTRRDGRGHILADGRRVHGKATLKISIDGNIDGFCDGAEMRERVVDRDAVVGPPERPCEARAGRGERWKPELRQQPRAADIPGIRNDEAAGLVKLTKGCATVGDGGHDQR